jgi:hypothetical protein
VADCQAGTPVDCNDGVACTVDSCNEGADSCDHTPDDALCDDGVFCDGAETCDAVSDCQPSTPPCDPATQTCNEGTDTCEPLGCTSDAECDNGVFCDGAETCDAPTGECLPGTPVDCNDGVGCTVDACNEGTDSCDNTPDDALCDDGAFCNGTETCDAVADCQAGTPVDCDDGVACTVDACNEGTDSCDHTPDDALCDDGAFCNGTETCDAVADCQAGTPVDCNDGVACTVDSCNEGTDSCDNTPNDALCDDGAFCNGAETCDAVNDCQPGTPVDCDDADICTDDACNESTDQCDHIVDPTNDSSCVPSVCGDGVVEGVEACDDGNTVDGDCCSASCQYEPSGSTCGDDGNACTNDVCDGAGVCTHPASSALCIVEAKMCGNTQLIAGCRASPILAAVVVDPEGDARDVQGAVTLNGATAGKLKLKSVAKAPAACGSLPPGQVFAGGLKLKAQGGGTLQIKLMATDTARNSSPSYTLPPYAIVPNTGPTVGEVTLSENTFQVGEKGALRVTAEVDDDCSVRRASVQIAPENGAFRSVGSLSDRGRKGDASAGDGIWSGVAKMQCRSAGTYDLRVAVEDGHGKFAYSNEFPLTCQ